MFDGTDVGLAAEVSGANGDLWVPEVRVGMDTLFSVVCGARQGDLAGRIDCIML